MSLTSLKSHKSLRPFHFHSALISRAALALALFLGLASLASAQSAPGAAFLRHIPAEHNAVVFLKPGQVMASPLYAQLKADPHFRPVHRHIAAFESATGLNAQRDIAEVLWSGLLMQPEQRFVLVARGRLNQSALVQRFKAAPGYQSAAYKSRTIHTWQDRPSGRLLHAAFLADDQILASDSPTTIRHALNAGADSAAASIQKHARARTLASRIAPQSAVWFLGLRNGTMPAEVYENPMLNTLQGVMWSANLGEQVDMNFHGELPDAQTAQQYRVMLEGMIAMTRFMGDEPLLQALARRAAVSHAGTGVAVQVSATNAEALALLRNAMEVSSH